MRLWPFHGSDNNKVRPLAAPSQWWYYAVGIVGGLVSLFLWYASILQSDTNLKHITRLEAEHIASDIKIQIELRTTALRHIAKHLEEGPETTNTDWDANIAEFINNYWEFKAITLLDSTLKPLLSTPDTHTTHQELIEFVTAFGSHFHEKTKLHTWISPPLGDEINKNIFIVVPLKLPQTQAVSYLAANVDLKNILSMQFNDNDYHVTVYANDQVVYQDHNNQAVFQPEIITLNIYNNLWKIYVEPSKHLAAVIKTDLPSVAMILGMTIAILFVLTTHLAKLARERARSIELIKEDLKLEIAERIEAQDSKQQLEKELYQGQKLQAIGTLAGGIAHDFNNILYAIIGYTEITREDVDKKSLIYTNLGKVLDAATRGQELISRILSFSRRQQHELQPITIRSMIDSVLALLKPTIPASVTMNVLDTLATNFMIMGDQSRLHQVLINLVNNAVDAMDGEGTITLKLSMINADNSLLQQFPNHYRGRYCKIELSDTGHGMDPHTTERIFEPFFTTKEVGKGTGLGLATVHTTIKEHRGEIIVKSQLGLGSTFIILLPEYKNLQE